jgi:NADH-quinone oxidoreductase subunit H
MDANAIINFILNPFVNLSYWFSKDVLKAFLPAEWAWLIGLIMNFATVMAVFGFLLGNTLYMTLTERKVIGRMQDRYGPNRAGPFGLFQPFADMIKMLIKEDIVPAWGDYWVHLLAAVIVIVPGLMAFAVIPLGQGMQGQDLDIGVLYIVALIGLTTVSLLMSGWGSRNKFAVLGGFRTAAQMISYEVPLVLATIPAIMLTGSMALSAQVQDQALDPNHLVWWGFSLVIRLLCFGVFFISGVATAKRAPFDIPEADSEIIAGFYTEYSGLKFGMFFLSEYFGLMAISALSVTLFLGGWQGPFVDAVPVLSVFYFLVKFYALFFVFMWFRGTLPRFRIDQLMAFSWKRLLPIALGLIFVTGVGMVVLRSLGWA